MPGAQAPGIPVLGADDQVGHVGQRAVAQPSARSRQRRRRQAVTALVTGGPRRCGAGRPWRSACWIGGLPVGAGTEETRGVGHELSSLALSLDGFSAASSFPSHTRHGWTLTCQSHMRSRRGSMTETTARIGTLIRDARQHQGLTQQSWPQPRHQPERGQPDRAGPPEPHPGDARPDRRGARLRDRRARRRARRTCGSPAADHAARARSTSRPPRTPASPCSAPRCSTAAARRCARSPASRRSTGSSRCSPASACRPAGCNDDNDLEIIPPARARPGRTSTTRPPAVPARSSCSSARCCTAPTPSSCRTPAAATSAPAPSSRTWRRCGPFGLDGQGHRRLLPRHGQPGHRAGAPDRADRARRHRHRERADGRRRAPGRHRHPQRLAQLHGPGPLLLPAGARRARSTASARRRCTVTGRARASTSTSTTRRARTRSRR